LSEISGEPEQGSRDFLFRHLEISVATFVFIALNHAFGSLYSGKSIQSL